MTPATLGLVRRPLLVGLVSAVCFVILIVLWLKFPSFVPISVLVIFGVVTAVTFLVSEVIVVLKILRTLRPPSQWAGVILNPRPRVLASLFIILALCNAGLLYFYHLRPNVGWALFVNLAAVISWLFGLAVSAKYMGSK